MIPWDDTRIQPGTKWREEIRTAVASAKAVILLVSADFLASDFIHENELPPLLAAAEEEGARIIPIIVNPDFSETPSLSQFQSANHPSQPLTGMGEDAQEAVFHKVAKAIKAASVKPLPAARERRSNLPERNPFFTGRDEVLAEIERALSLQGRAGLSGMGGAGKTQTAVEYAYRHATEYSEILWTSAASREALISGYSAIAGLLNLPEHASEDQTLAINAVKRWFVSRRDWLLILDNADDIGMVRSFLPEKNGHLLLTTRARALGPAAQFVELKKMETEEGAMFLLRRNSQVLPAGSGCPCKNAGDSSPGPKGAARTNERFGATRLGGTRRSRRVPCISVG